VRPAIWLFTLAALCTVVVRRHGPETVSVSFPADWPCASEMLTLRARVSGEATMRYRVSAMTSLGVLRDTAISPDGRVCQTDYWPPVKAPSDPTGATVTFAFTSTSPGHPDLRKSVRLWCYAEGTVSAGAVPLPRGSRTAPAVGTMTIVGRRVDLARFGSLTLWTDELHARGAFGHAQRVYIEDSRSPDKPPVVQGWSATQGTIEDCGGTSELDRPARYLLFRPWRDGEQMKAGVALVALAVRSVANPGNVPSGAAFACRVYADGTSELIRSPSAARPPAGSNMATDDAL